MITIILITFSITIIIIIITPVNIIIIIQVAPKINDVTQELKGKARHRSRSKFRLY